MKRILMHLCVIAAMFVCISSAQAQSEWAKFSPEGGRFSILMPGTPKPEVETTKESPHGPYTTYLFTSVAEGAIYLVAWVDYDPSFNFGVQAEINANRDNYLKGVKGTLTGEKKIVLKGGHPGTEFTADVGTDRFTISRVYIVGRRPYQMVAITKKGADLVNVNKFLSSFALTSN